MANEPIIIELLGTNGDGISYTVADASAIPKNSLMKLTDPRTVALHAAAADVPIVGIAAHEKVANDGSTRMTVYTNLIADVTAAAAGAQNVGKMVACSATAQMSTAADANDLLQNSTIGMVLEEQANDEVAAVRILK
jgi:hypothetical protein